MSAVGGVPFGEALRRWRGLRRVSQLELALEAGTTQRHLSFVEQGRSAPGRGLVLRLAESLQLPLRDRNALLLTAGYAPAYPESGLDSDTLRAVRGALEVVLRGHEPYPAMIVNRLGDSDTVGAQVRQDPPPPARQPDVRIRRHRGEPQGRRQGGPPRPRLPRPA